MTKWRLVKNVSFLRFKLFDLLWALLCKRSLFPLQLEKVDPYLARTVELWWFWNNNTGKVRVAFWFGIDNLPAFKLILRTTTLLVIIVRASMMGMGGTGIRFFEISIWVVVIGIDRYSISILKVVVWLCNYGLWHALHFVRRILLVELGYTGLLYSLKTLKISPNVNWLGWKQKPFAVDLQLPVLIEYGWKYSSPNLDCRWIHFFPMSIIILIIFFADIKNSY